MIYNLYVVEVFITLDKKRSPQLTFKYIWTNHLSKNNKGYTHVGTINQTSTSKATTQQHNFECLCSMFTIHHVGVVLQFSVHHTDGSKLMHKSRLLDSQFHQFKHMSPFPRIHSFQTHPRMSFRFSMKSLCLQMRPFKMILHVHVHKMVRVE